jgi:hypothetical protein
LNGGSAADSEYRVPQSQLATASVRRKLPFPLHADYIPRVAVAEPPQFNWRIAKNVYQLRGIFL